MMAVILAAGLILTWPGIGLGRGGFGGGGRSSGGSHSYGGGSRSSSFGSRSSSSSYGGGSRSSSAAPATRSGGYGGGSKSSPSARPANSYAGGRPASAAPRSRLDAAANTRISKQQAASALGAYRASRSNFTGAASTARSSAATQSAVMRNFGGGGTPRVTINNYYVHRQRFYGGYAPPIYSRSWAPSYGIWDTVFLCYMMSHLSNPSYSRWYYCHYDDPAVMTWRRQAEVEAAKNADLRRQLAEADAAKTSLAGQPRDPAYIPADVGAAALSEEAARANLAADIEPSGSPMLKFLLWMLILGGVLMVAVYFVKAKRCA